jgi:hypothetical protein
MPLSVNSGRGAVAINGGHHGYGAAGEVRPTDPQRAGSNISCLYTSSSRLPLLRIRAYQLCFAGPNRTDLVIFFGTVVTQVIVEAGQDPVAEAVKRLADADAVILAGMGPYISGAMMSQLPKLRMIGASTTVKNQASVG